jgi:hypothetical protein
MAVKFLTATLHEQLIFRPHTVSAEESVQKKKLLINHHRFNLGVNIRDALKIYKNLLNAKRKATPVTDSGGPCGWRDVEAPTFSR